MVRNATFSQHASVGLHVNFGSADEGPLERGQAHLLEHLLVRTHFPNSLALSATTGRERTSFQLVTSVNHVRRAVEKLKRLVTERIPITDEMLAEEKGIVIREINERHHTKSWRVREAAFNALWSGTPYAHDPLGGTDDLKDLGLATLARTLDQQYISRNAILVIVGGADLTDQVSKEDWPKSFFPAGDKSTLPSGPTCVPLQWGQEELGHVFAWADDMAQPRSRLVNRMGGVRFQQLALRAGWLTWVWVPPCTDPHLAVDRQLTATLSALSTSESLLLSEFRIAELKRLERVETVAHQTVDELWTQGSEATTLALSEGIEYWRDLAQRAG